MNESKSVIEEKKLKVNLQFLIFSNLLSLLLLLTKEKKNKD